MFAFVIAHCRSGIHLKSELRPQIKVISKQDFLTLVESIVMIQAVDDNDSNGSSTCNQSCAMIKNLYINETLFVTNLHKSSTSSTC